MDDDKEWAKLRALVQEMREALEVDAAMMLRHEDRIKEHQKWLEEHEITMARVEANLDRLAELILRGRPTNGNQPA
jgi:uncharacterized coiled-coil protein SlyX